MPLIHNTNKPTNNITSTGNKVVPYETWNSNTTTWATETRTWNQMSSKMSNTNINTDPLWSYRSFPWIKTLPWQQTGGIINTNKP